MASVSKVGASGFVRIVRIAKRSFHEETSCQQQKVAQPIGTRGAKVNQRLVRPLVIVSALGALAASSQATITFGGWPSGSLPSDVTVKSPGDIQIQNPNLGDLNLQGAGVLTYTEDIGVTESGSSIVKATIDEVLSGVSFGTLSLIASVDGNVIYNDTVLNFDNTGSTESTLLPNGSIDILLGAGLHHFSYTATYVGFDNSLPSYGYINSFNAFFQENATPEPSSIAAIGFGLIGICARRRRGVK